MEEPKDAAEYQRRCRYWDTYNATLCALDDHYDSATERAADIEKFHRDATEQAARAHGELEGATTHVGSFTMLHNPNFPDDAAVQFMRGVNELVAAATRVVVDFGSVDRWDVSRIWELQDALRKFQ